MNNKVLSISIAAYNVSKTIRETINSLLLETSYLRKLDIIIVNDGSKDGTLDIIKEYALNYPDSIRVIDKQNGGYGSTINSSLSIAKGKYYRLLDGDDYFIQEALVHLLDFLEKTDVDLIIGPYYEISDTKIKIEHHPEIPSEVNTIESLSLGNDKVIHMHGVTVKTEVLRHYNHRITEKCFYTDTEYVYVCLSASSTVVRFNEAVYCYRLGEVGQSVSLDGIRKHYLEAVKVANKLSGCYNRTNYKGGKKELIEGSLCLIIYWVYCVYMLLYDPIKHKKELIEFDEELQRKYPDAYKASMNSKLVKMVRATKFHGYKLFCNYIMRKLISHR